MCGGVGGFLGWGGCGLCCVFWGGVCCFFLFFFLWGVGWFVLGVCLVCFGGVFFFGVGGLFFCFGCVLWYVFLFGGFGVFLFLLLFGVVWFFFFVFCFVLVLGVVLGGGCCRGLFFWGGGLTENARLSLILNGIGIDSETLQKVPRGVKVARGRKNQCVVTPVSKPRRKLSPELYLSTQDRKADEPSACP